MLAINVFRMLVIEQNGFIVVLYGKNNFAERFAKILAGYGSEN